jgi:DNA polymerase-4
MFADSTHSEISGQASSSQDRIILHVDFDSFFASVEQQTNPYLRNKPIGVTAVNGRTCIIAASREAKKVGIKAGGNIWEARSIYPNIKLVSAEFDKYYEIYKRFLSICKDYTPYTEFFSLDEAFLDMTSTIHLFGSMDNMVKSIKKRIREEIGEYITASVGISHNKLLAKLASGHKKPDGVFAITEENLDTVYRSIKLTDICGIGERIKARLQMMGIYSLIKLRQVPLNLLVSEFGPHEAQFLRNVSLGIDTSPVIPYTQAPEVKSVGRNYCLPENEYDQRLILQNVFELSEEVGRKLRKLNRKARTVGLYLQGNRGESGIKTVSQYIDSGKDIYSYCKAFYDAWEWDKHPFEEQRMVRQMSVWVENLAENNTISNSIFSYLSKTDETAKVIDTINDKYGHYALRNGFLLEAPKLKTVPNGYGADKYDRTVLAQKGL